MVVRRAVFGLAAASVAACSLVTAGLDLDSSFGERVGSGDLDADGANVANDAGPPDVHEVISAFRCAPDAHALCDTFDQGDLGDPSVWTRIVNGAPTATIALANDRYASAPRSLLGTLPEALLDVTEQNAMLERVFTSGFGSISCSLKLRVEATRTTGHVSPLEIYFSAPPDSGLAETQIDFSLTAGVASLFYLQSETSEIGVKEDFPLDGSFPILTWVDVKLRVDREPGGRIVAALLINGNDVANAYPNFRTDSTVSVRVGVIHGVPAAAPLNFLIDDVVCDLK